MYAHFGQSGHSKITDQSQQNLTACPAHSGDAHRPVYKEAGTTATNSSALPGRSGQSIDNGSHVIATHGQGIPSHVGPQDRIGEEVPPSEDAHLVAPHQHMENTKDKKKKKKTSKRFTKIENASPRIGKADPVASTPIKPFEGSSADIASVDPCILLTNTFLSKSLVPTNTTPNSDPQLNNHFEEGLVPIIGSPSEGTNSSSSKSLVPTNTTPNSDTQVNNHFEEDPGSVNGTPSEDPNSFSSKLLVINNTTPNSDTQVNNHFEEDPGSVNGTPSEGTNSFSSKSPITNNTTANSDTQVYNHFEEDPDPVNGTPSEGTNSFSIKSLVPTNTTANSNHLVNNHFEEDPGSVNGTPSEGTHSFSSKSLVPTNTTANSDTQVNNHFEEDPGSVNGTPSEGTNSFSSKSLVPTNTKPNSDHLVNNHFEEDPDSVNGTPSEGTNSFSKKSNTTPNSDTQVNNHFEEDPGPVNGTPSEGTNSSSLKSFVTNNPNTQVNNHFELDPVSVNSTFLENTDSSSLKSLVSTNARTSSDPLVKNYFEEGLVRSNANASENTDSSSSKSLVTTNATPNSDTQVNNHFEEGFVPTNTNASEGTNSSSSKSLVTTNARTNSDPQLNNHFEEGLVPMIGSPSEGTNSFSSKSLVTTNARANSDPQLNNHFEEGFIRSNANASESTDLSSVDTTSLNESKPILKPKKLKKSLSRTLSNLDFDKCSPDICVTLMHRPTIQNVGALKRKLKSCSTDWLQAFVTQGGLDNLLDYSSGQRHLHQLSDALLLLECISCVRVVMNSRQGLEYTINTHYTTKLIKTLDSPNVMVKSEVFELLSVLCIYSNDGYESTLNAIDLIKVSKDERYRFSFIVNELKTTEVIPYKRNLMAFINCILFAMDGFTERMKIRQEFIDLNLESVLKELRNLNDDKLTIQCDTFEQDKRHDEAILSLAENSKRGDIRRHQDFFLGICQNVLGTPHSESFLNILQSLKQIDSETEVGEQQWAIVESIAQNLLSLEKSHFLQKLLVDIETEVEIQRENGYRSDSPSLVTLNNSHTTADSTYGSEPDDLSPIDHRHSTQQILTRPELSKNQLPRNRSLPEFISDDLPKVRPGDSKTSRKWMEKVKRHTRRHSLSSIVTPTNEDSSDPKLLSEEWDLSSVSSNENETLLPLPVAEDWNADRVKNRETKPFQSCTNLTHCTTWNGKTEFKNSASIADVQPKFKYTDKNVWQEVQQVNTENLKVDFDLLENLFSLKNGQKTTTGPQRKKTEAVQKKISLLNRQRSLDIAIFLRQFKGSQETILQNIRDGKRQNFGLEKLKQMQKFLPTEDEVSILNSYEGDPSKLADPEKFCVDLIKIPFYKIHLKGMLVMEEKTSLIQTIKPNIEMEKQICLDLMTNQDLKAFLALILQVGNYMNMGRHAGNAMGFEISSAIQIVNETKSNESGLNLLHFLVSQAEKLNTLGFVEQLQTTVQNASRLSVQFLQEEVQNFKNNLNQLNSALKNCDEKIKNFYGTFVKETRVEISELENELQEISSMTQKLRIYFCENEKEFQLEIFLNKFNKFLQSMKECQKENKKRRIRQEILVRNQKKKEQKISQKTEQKFTITKDGTLNHFLSCLANKSLKKWTTRLQY